ncbi:MAG: hypothetical protein JOZ81_21790 [Chloroflexi bacterium]|nr:hypothetical protein [Chloroflexota bacterium]
MTRLLLIVWRIAVGPTPGRLPTLRNSVNPTIQGGLRILMDLITLFVWLLISPTGVTH